MVTQDPSLASKQVMPNLLQVRDAKDMPRGCFPVSAKQAKWVNSLLNKANPQYMRMCTDVSVRSAVNGAFVFHWMWRKWGDKRNEPHD